MPIRKSSKDNLVLLALGTITFIALTIEHGPTRGAIVVAGLVFAGSLMMLASAALSSVADHQLRFTRTDFLLIAYSAVYAILALSLGWPGFVFLAVVGPLSGAAIWLAVRIFIRQQ